LPNVTQVVHERSSQELLIIIVLFEVRLLKVSIEVEVVLGVVS